MMMVTSQKMIGQLLVYKPEVQGGFDLVGNGSPSILR